MGDEVDDKDFVPQTRREILCANQRWPESFTQARINDFVVHEMPTLRHMDNAHIQLVDISESREFLSTARSFS
jgi:hypothetical protein